MARIETPRRVRGTQDIFGDEQRRFARVVEAFELADRPEVFAVQWHPEWQYAHNPASLALFTAFGEACRQYRQARTGQPALPTPQGEAR